MPVLQDFYGKENNHFLFNALEFPFFKGSLGTADRLRIEILIKFHNSAADYFTEGQLIEVFGADLVEL